MSEWDKKAAESYDQHVAVSAFADAVTARLRGYNWFSDGSVKLDVLDYGCGTGILALRMAAMGHRITGVDYSQDMLAVFEKKLAVAAELVESVKLYHSEAGDGTGFPEGRFDVIVVTFVLHHVNSVAIKTLIGNLASRLKPGGHLFVSEFEETARTHAALKSFHKPPEGADQSQHEEHHRHHVEWLKRKTLEEFMNECGLEVESSEAMEVRGFPHDSSQVMDCFTVVGRAGHE